MQPHGQIAHGGEHELRATGLHDVAMHDVVEIDGEIPALVVALEREHVVLAPLLSTHIRPGASVTVRGKAVTQVDLSLLGRVVTGSELLGRSAPGAGELTARRTLFPLSSRPRWRTPRKRGTFTTGLLVHDMKGQLRRGDAILLSGAESDSTFTLRIASHILRHQETTGAFCVFVRLQPTPGSCDSRQLLSLVSSYRSSAFIDTVWSRTLFLEPGQQGTAAMSWLLCRAAVAVAQAFAEQGADVVLMVDGFQQLRGTGFARLPGWSAQAELGRLTSAADGHDTGSLTTIFTSHQPAARDDLQLFDAQLDLQRTRLGQIPVRGSTLCRPPVRVQPMNALRRLLLASAQAEQAHGLTVTGDTTIQRGRRIQEVLRHQTVAGLDLLEQLLCGLAVEGLDSLALHDVARFAESYIRALRERHPRYLRSLRDANLVPDDPSELWAKVAAETAARLT